MGKIEAFHLVAGSLYMITITIVGVRLLILARRNRAWPEFFLGMSLLVGGTLGASLEASGLSMLQAKGPEMGGPLIMLGKTFGLGGVLGQGLFIWKVFRPEDRWAGFLTAGLVALPAIALVGFFQSGTLASAELPTTLFFLEFVGRIGGSCWLLVESIRYYGLMKRRLAIGLADPVVVNRFLLWSSAGACSLVMLFTSVPPVFLDHSFQTLMAMDLVVFALSGIMTCAFYTLTFFPPAAYKNWLLGRQLGEA